MSPLAVISVAIALVAVALAVVNFVMTSRREAGREARERAVSKAAHEYLGRHGISSRTIGAVLADGSMALMIETAPHKKLRFSYVIEPSIKAYVLKMAGVEPKWVFWRFPINEAAAKAPEVRYGEASVAPAGAAPVATAESVAAPGKSPASGDGLDDYLHHHRSYHIEEVSWNDFNNTVSGSDTPKSA